MEITCTAFNKSINHSSNDFHVKEYDGIVCLYQFHTIQTPIKQQHIIYVPKRLTFHISKKHISDVMVCVLTSGAVVDRVSGQTKNL